MDAKTVAVPAAPEFGDALAPQASPETIALLARRRSSSAQTLGAPGPSHDQLKLLLRLAARVPDHGKLSPWRFIVLQQPAKADLVRRFEAVAARREDAAKALAKLAKLSAAPLSVAVVSRLSPDADIPVWEQELSSGAVCTMLLTAAAALGYGANWITDWYAYDSETCAILGLDAEERIAGIVHVGTPAEAPLERARPDVEALTSYWAG
ncbi:MAG TPA: nitroreductase family protein [Caulobacteraceae bacterium]|jgi:nitroreductase|nr:nitroreductase family protein [Caulobacteraceae bacterium]